MCNLEQPILGTIERDDSGIGMSALPPAGVAARESDVTQPFGQRGEFVINEVKN